MCERAWFRSGIHTRLRCEVRRSLKDRVPSLVRTPEVWNNGGPLAGPTSPGSFSPVVWRCLSGTSSHCMLPSLVFSMFISVPYQTLCAPVLVFGKTII